MFISTSTQVCIQPGVQWMSGPPFVFFYTPNLLQNLLPHLPTYCTRNKIHRCGTSMFCAVENKKTLVAGVERSGDSWCVLEATLMQIVAQQKLGPDGTMSHPQAFFFFSQWMRSHSVSTNSFREGFMKTFFSYFWRNPQFSMGFRMEKVNVTGSIFRLVQYLNCKTWSISCWPAKIMEILSK